MTYALIIIASLFFSIALQSAGALYTGLTFGILGCYVYYHHQTLRRYQENIKTLRHQVSVLIDNNITAPSKQSSGEEPSATQTTEASKSSGATGAEWNLASTNETALAPWARPTEKNSNQTGSQTSTPDIFPTNEWLQKFKRVALEGNPVARIGILVLFFGVSFLLKYIAQLGLISIEIRLIAVAVAGITMVYGGWTLRKRNNQFSLLMQGAGIGIVYLTGFTAARLYHVISPEVAFACMLLTVIASALLAVIQNARSLAFFASLGGFLAPVMVTQNTGSHVTLFSYYALLNCGLLAIAWYRSWRELNVLGFVFTFAIGGLWGFFEYLPAYVSTLEPFLIFHFLLFLAISVLFALRQPPRLTGYVDGTLVFGLPLVAFGFQAELIAHIDNALAQSAVTLAAIYGFLSYFLFRRDKKLHLLAESFMALAVVFATLAVPLAFSKQWTSMTWALEGLALLWLGLRQEKRLSRVFGLLLQLVAGLTAPSRDHITLNPDWPDAYSLTLIDFRLSFSITQNLFLVAVTGLASAWMLSRYLPVLKKRLPGEINFRWYLLVWGVYWWLFTGSREILGWVSDGYVPGALALFLMLTALLFYQLSRLLRWREISVPLLGYVPLLAVLGLLTFLETDHWFENITGLFWVPVFLAGYYLLYQYRYELSDTLSRKYQFALYWQILFFVSWELNHRIDTLTVDGSHWPYVAWFLPAIVTTVILSRMQPLSYWPLNTDLHQWKSWGSVIPLGIMSYCSVFLLILSDGGVATSYVPFYVPLLNPPELTTLLLLACIAYWYLGIRKEEHGLAGLFLDQKLIYTVAGTLIFTLLNTGLARCLHHYYSIDFNFQAMWKDGLFQAGIAIVWTVTALVATVSGNWFRLRSLWTIGASLLGLVVLKLFIIDLANSETMERIVTFITVGGLLMAIGYFAPLPPKPSLEEKSS